MRLLPLLFALFASSSALAVDAQRDEYLGASLSLARHSVAMAGGAYSSPSKSDSNTAGYSLQAGFYSHENLSWELDYQNYGKNNRSYSDGRKAESALSSVGISAIGHLPLNQKLGLFGRAGLARVESKTTVNNGEAWKARKTALVLGAGVEYQVDANLRAFAELARSSKVKSSVNTGGGEDSHSATRLSAGLNYLF